MCVRMVHPQLWSPSCQAEGSLLGRGEHQGTTLGPCMAHTPPIRVTVAGLLLTLAGYSHAGAPAAALVMVAGCGMQRQDHCAGACGTSRPVIQKDRFVLLKRKKNKWEKKKMQGLACLGPGDRGWHHMPCSVLSPGDWGGKTPSTVPGGADVRLK